MYAFWKYSQVHSLAFIWAVLTFVFQKLLGFEFVDNEKTTPERALDDDEKDLVYKLCFASDDMDDYSMNICDSGSILDVIMVQETKLQAEIVYVLHAVTQFMNWWIHFNYLNVFVLFDTCDKVYNFNCSIMEYF